MNFKRWVEDSVNPNSNNPQQMNDPTILAANQQANIAAKKAVQNKKNPIQAAQNAVLQANVPSNKLGAVMPKDPDEQDDQS